MVLSNFTTEQIFVPKKSPSVKRWIIGIDIGYSSVKAFAPEKWYCFPSFVKKIANKLMTTNENDIYYRDEEGLYIIGTQAQELVTAGDTSDAASQYDRDRYFTKEFRILARTALAIGLEEADPSMRPFVQTGLPAAYLKEDASKIRSAFMVPGTYEVKIGTGKWKKYDMNLKKGDVSVISQPTGTLNSILIGEDGEERPATRSLLEKNLLVADFGFGTFDPYGIVHRSRVLEESFNDLGMKRVLETAAKYIYDDYFLDVRIPQMRKYMRDGYVTVVDIANMSSKRVPLAPYIERACNEVAELAAKKLYEVAHYFQDYQYLIITGGTGAAWYEILKDKFKNFEELTVMPGNDGNDLPIYMANVRGYYMYAYRRIRREGRDNV